MALTQSNPLPLGTKAPNFTLPDVISGRTVSLEELKSDKGTVVMFICNHCPYVLHILDELVRTADEYQKRGISFIAINSNDVTQYPEDSPEKMKEMAHKKSFPFPYLFDEDQSVAKSYSAACTPDIYVFDGDLKLVYHGQFDDSRYGNDIPVTGKDLRSALDALLSGKEIPSDQKPSMGCNIKWKK